MLWVPLVTLDCQVAIFLGEFFLRQPENCKNGVDMRAMTRYVLYLLKLRKITSPSSVGTRKAGCCMISHSFFFCSLDW